MRRSWHVCPKGMGHGDVTPRTALACSEEGMLWVAQCLGGTSGDANLQEEASRGRIGLNLVRRRHTIWWRCPRVASLTSAWLGQPVLPSPGWVPARQSCFACRKGSHIPSPQQKARRDGQSGRTRECSSPASRASVPGCPAPPVWQGLIRKMDMKVELGSGFSLIQNIQKLLTVVGVSRQLVLISCSSNCVGFFFSPCFSRAL